MAVTTESNTRRYQASDWRELITKAVGLLWPELKDGPAWIESQVHVESGGDPQAVSSCGAQGLLQLMPTTAAGLGVSNPFDPSENLSGGIRYLRRQYDALRELPEATERLRWAFASYNAGLGYIDFDGEPSNTCLELAKDALPGDWWRWDIGRHWLPEVQHHGRHPDYRQIWTYVSRIEIHFHLLKGAPPREPS